MHLEVLGPVTPKVSIIAFLPFLAVLIPFIGAVFAAIFSGKTKIRNAIVVSTTILTFVIVLCMYQPVVQGIHIGEHFYRGIECSFPSGLGFGINFGVDAVGLLIAAITAFIWALSCIYATSYMSVEHAQGRYYFFALLTLGANLGVLLTKDFFSLFLFFELLAVFSYVLVVHEETEEAMAAGRLYLYMSVIGGLLLLGGIIILAAKVGKIDIAPMAALMKKTMPSYLRYLVAIMMIAGFGSKAGIFFLHVWLPEAHPIAPTPASALLSGLMIKAGAYGILRTVNTLFAPVARAAAHSSTHASHATQAAQAAHGAGWTMLTSLGYGLIWIGVITMFFGVVNALLSPNCKRMLAYHSVSQMGYIVMGLGCAAYLGTDGAMGLAGGLYHIVNHALFKAGLFLAIGAVYFRTRELDMYKLGGMWRNMPFTALACFIAVCGISGIPLFNGFASKTILHHAILEAYEHSAHYSAVHRPDILLIIAEVFFVLTAFGTFCSNMKMWSFVFIWKRPEKFKDVEPEPLSMRIAMFAISAAILFIGLKPNWLLEKFIGPALANFGFDPVSHPYHILYNIHATGLRSTIPLLYDPKTYAFLTNPEVVHNLLGLSICILGGGMYFILGYRFGWFHVDPPEWVSIKYWYLKLAAGTVFLISKVSIFISDAVDKSYYALSDAFLLTPKLITKYKRRFQDTVVPVIFGLPEEEEVAAERRELLERLEDRKIAMVRKAVRQATLEMIREEVSVEERRKKLARVREEAMKEAEAIAQAELDMFREAILRMAEAGLPAAERRRRIMDIMRLVDVMREAGAKVTSMEKVEAMEEPLKEATAKVAKMPAAVSMDIIADVVKEAAAKMA
ncbi:MAG: proton-conducting transporter membrane subunit, partial [Actinomycetota bacterium]